MKHRLLLLTSIATLAVAAFSRASTSLIDEAWQNAAPREEIRPHFAFDPNGGRGAPASLLIEADAREGLAGHWFKTVPVKGGEHYRFSAWRNAEGIEEVRRSVVARIVWQDREGKPVPSDGPGVPNVLKGWTPRAEPEYPADCPPDSQGWAEVSGVYRAPSAAAQARLELHLQWAPRGKVRWSDVVFEPTARPGGRKVRLAAIHFRPEGGKTPEGNCRLFAPLVAEAAKQRADLVVLPETLTFFGLGRKYGDCAESVPGPSTDYFGALAREHNLYIVAGLIERDGHLI
ncbi:MAG: carbon-nitrogen hydrolase family protein, partial [Verrucomicrobiota bacterium]|nr:carbon-nitrogen hydrolase family protein [Verrucomicrobiota bacterium]